MIKSCFNILLIFVLTILRMTVFLLYVCPVILGFIYLYCFRILDEPDNNSKQEMQYVEQPLPEYEEVTVVNDNDSGTKEEYTIFELIKSIKLPGYPREVIFVEISETDLENLGRIVRTNSLNQTEQ